MVQFTFVPADETVVAKVTHSVRRAMPSPVVHQRGEGEDLVQCRLRETRFVKVAAPNVRFFLACCYYESSECAQPHVSINEGSLLSDRVES